MSIITAQVQETASPQFFAKYFSLSVASQNKETRIIMQVYSATLHTGTIMQTLPILQRSLPTILTSTCFNDAHLPFVKEVQHTEIGHLFEHILLEYLCDLKAAIGHIHPIYNGVTTWNWEKDAQGTFHIWIDTGEKEKDILYQAISLSISLLEEILEHDPLKKRKKITPKPFTYQLN